MASLFKRHATNSPSALKQTINLDEDRNAINLIIDHLKKLDAKLDDLTAKVNKFSDSSPPWYRNTLPPLMKDLAENNPVIGSLAFSSFILHESAKMQEKSCNAVLEKFPDVPNRAQGKEKLSSDGNMINDTCTKAGIPIPLDYWRQPSKNPNHPRVIKVHFGTVDERDDFLRAFRKNYQGTGRPPIARRDLTVPELQLLYELKKEAYDANINCGKGRFYVHDLTIRESKDPKPFVNRK